MIGIDHSRYRSGKHISALDYLNHEVGLWYILLYLSYLSNVMFGRSVRSFVSPWVLGTLHCHLLVPFFLALLSSTAAVSGVLIQLYPSAVWQKYECTNAPYIICAPGGIRTSLAVFMHGRSSYCYLWCTLFGLSTTEYLLQCTVSVRVLHSL